MELRRFIAGSVKRSPSYLARLHDCEVDHAVSVPWPLSDILPTIVVRCYALSCNLGNGRRFLAFKINSLQTKAGYAPMGRNTAGRNIEGIIR